ncbi:MAG TPA: class I SAM-dependent methyltransferase [Acidimicrobiia bacterium]
MPTREEAESFPRGRIDLGFCSDCGFIGNTSFEPLLTRYSADYEESQAFSARFVDFAGNLARDWVYRHGLAGKHVVEIGCGKGEFLVMMAEAGIGSGLGIDPGVDPERIGSSGADRLRWESALFDTSYGPLVADAIVCRHTLEHVPNVKEFLVDIRSAIGDKMDTVLLFELPDTIRVLEEAAFWDVYYEHCSYFSEGSLARLFESCGFEVLDVSLAYDDQYLLLEARPVSASPASRWLADDMARLERGTTQFASGYEAIVAKWRDRLTRIQSRGGKSVIWGASSKGVSFLGLVGDLVEAAVDVNPNKHGTYVAGSGHRIVAPRQLVSIAPELVVVMNPIYLDEIGAEMGQLGVNAEIVAV